ncbi:quinone-dependent dihydroorotate dehydrogenase [Sulfitobacter sp. D35]|uniref:quinone-dependent dihydroorotate dehydrogenase n=1 Tax=Sulfitobacter sp. D35 TaxID=3083252 RepID=UPI00296FEF25|nr:quinone-dependent dihydroorotate dehydrogenase [Sulfitobacter sp. D35]MDW4498706.1 quinone-dependent dihydroorotate dehydrogenase [Sulfitobacter sp. D35]
MNARLERAGLALLRRTDPERAHGLALAALRSGLTAAPGPISSDRLRIEVAGLVLANPLGLAAGFDKNAQAVRPLSRAGFGFVEVGAATPLAQPGNPRPRLFRLTEDGAAINRFGFNNDGMETICARLARTDAEVPVGLNLGANKSSADRAADFARVLERARPHIAFATVNVSSPNTERLRDLQGAKALAALLEGVMQVRGDTPVFLKIAPDLDAAELADVAKVAENAGVAAIIATNTTLARDGLRSARRFESGGLSGQPLFDRSTRVLARLSGLTDLPLIGVGGIGSAEQAYAKIRAGASALQLYTALVYGGLSLVREILEGLDDLLNRDGFSNVAEATGTGRKDWE